MNSFEWDDEKRAAALEKHGIDFLDATRIFTGPVLRARSTFEGEDRWIAVGLLDGLEIAVIYTLRDSTCRIITARRARTNERKRYHENYPG
ncbi:MAG: BrnT family toxin [Candidatus Microsaccharimonas sp.]